MQDKFILAVRKAYQPYKQHYRSRDCPAACQSKTTHVRLAYGKVTEHRYIEVQRVEVCDKEVESVRQNFHEIKYRGQKHPGGNKNAPDVLGVPKKDIGLGKKQSQPYTKNIQLNNRNKDKNITPRKGDIHGNNQNNKRPQ
jgi:hypothetical protein